MSAFDSQAENQIKRNSTTHRRYLSRRSKAKATEPVESQPVAAAKQSETTYFADLSLVTVLIMRDARIGEKQKGHEKPKNIQQIHRKISAIRRKQHNYYDYNIEEFATTIA